ncbi:MAG: hypothetical protein RR054_04890 [Clostridia bacterium]
MKKSIIFWCISALFIIAGVILFFTMGFNNGVDFVGGTQVEVMFNKTVTDSEYETIRSDIKTKLEKLGFNADNGRMLKTVKIISGVRFTFTQNATAEQVKSIAAENMTISVNNIRAYKNDAVTLIWVLAIAWALIVVYTFARNWKSEKIASSVSLAAVMLHDILLMLSVNLLLGKLLNIQVNNEFLVAIAATLGLSAVFNSIAVNSVKNNICPCKRIVVIAIIGFIATITLAIFGFVPLAIQMAVGIIVTAYSALCLTGGLFTSLKKNK